MSATFLIPTWLFVLIIIGFSAGLVGFAVWWYFLRWRNSFNAHIMVDSEDVKTVKVKKNKKSFKWGKKTYKTDLSGAIRNKRHTPQVYYDVDHITPLKFSGIRNKKNPEDLGDYMDSQALRNILNRDSTRRLFLLMVIAIIAVGITAGVGFFFINSSNQSVNNLFEQYMNITNGGKLR